MPMAEKSEYPYLIKDISIQNLSDTAPFPDLLNGDIHIWTVPIDVPESQVEYFQSVLTPEEKSKASFFKFEPSQHSYLVTKAVLRILLSGYLNIRPVDIVLGAHKKGKPYLVHDASIFFNLSNSHDLCVYAFSRDAEVGIDIEKIRDLPDIDQLIAKNLTSREKKYFQKDPVNKLTKFFRFWTFKESFLKAIGEGMRLTPENLEFSVENGTIKLRSVNYGFDGSDWRFKGFTREGNYTGTLAYSGKDTIIQEMSIAFT